MKLTLHIGVEKTGTTSIQAALAKDRARLSACGVLYPTLFGSANHMELAVAASLPDPLDELQIIEFSNQQCGHEEYRERLRSVITDELSRNRFSGIIISNEHCHSRLKDVDAIRRLIELFPVKVEDCNAIIYLRRQDRLAVSLYSTILRLGGSSSVFLDFEEHERPYYFEFDRILENYSEVLGVERIQVHLFEPDLFVNRDVVAHFYKAVGFGIQPSAVSKENCSIPFIQAAFLRHFNSRFPLSVDGKLNELRGEIEAALQFAPTGPVYRPKKDAARAFYDRFHAGNERVRSRFMPHLARSTLFDEDFSDYPSIEPNWQLTESQCFDFIEALWTYSNKQLHYVKGEMGSAGKN